MNQELRPILFFKPINFFSAVVIAFRFFVFLKIQLYSYARMKGKKRSELALAAFRAEDGPRALMLPVKTGAHGLNLVSFSAVKINLHRRRSIVCRILMGPKLVGSVLVENTIAVCLRTFNCLFENCCFT